MSQHPPHRFSVAPMMDWTDRHCRVFHRLLAPSARLYTEMVHANAVIHGDRERLLGFDASEQPLALQLGGSEPALLAQAARIAGEWGYVEVNLNCGCPSDRVQAGRFGACLMREPALVADCVAAMRAATDVPLDIMRASRRALREASVIATHSIRSAHGDVAVAIELLRATVRSTGMTIDANLASLKDADYVGLVKEERERLEEESAADADNALSFVTKRSG